MGKPLIVITGVCGRIGRAASSLFSKDFQVVGLDVISPKEPCPEVDYLVADISSLDEVKKTFETIKERYGNQIVSFIHLAAYYNFSGGEWEKYEQITINGTRNLLKGLKDFQLEQFVFSSTLLVHDPVEIGEKIHELSEVNPKWEYPLSKIKTEELIHEMRGEAKSVILRIAGVYDDECNSIPISQHILRIYRKELESHFFPGDINSGAAFLHMDDLVRALVLVVGKRKELDDEEIFVLGEPIVMSFQELQNTIGILLHGKPWWTVPIPKWVAKMGAHMKKWLPGKSFIQPWMIDLADDHYDIDIARAEEKLEWHPAHSLKNCLPKMVGDLKKNPEKWVAQHEI